MRKAILFVSLIAILAVPRVGAVDVSSKMLQEIAFALTNGGRFGSPRYTTALLPTCDSTNQGATAFDTTATTLKFCDGTTWTSAGGAGANAALSNLASVAINTALLPNAAGTIDFGSATLPWRDYFLAGSSGTPGTNNFRITGASTSGTRVVTLPDASTTLPVATQVITFSGPSAARTYTLPDASVTLANATLGNLGSVAINTTLLPSAVDTVALGSTSLPFTIGYLGESSSLFGAIGWNKNVTNHDLTVQTDSTNRRVLLIDKANIGFNYAAANASHPTLTIFSVNQNTTQHIDISHNGTNGVITTGTGALDLSGPSMVIAAAGSASTPTYVYTGGTTTGSFLATSSAVGFASSGTDKWLYGGSGITVINSYQIGWSSNTSSLTAPDLILTRSAAATLQLGAANAASPVAQILQSQGSRGGTDTDTAGGSLTIHPGTGTGTGGSGDMIVQAAEAGSTGSTANTQQDRVRIVAKAKSVTNNSATSILAFTLASGSNAGGNIDYCVESTNGTDFQTVCGIVAVACTNKAGTFANNASILGTEARITSTGTMTTAFDFAATSCTLRLTANSSLTSITAGYPRIRYTVMNNGTQAITPQ